MALPKPVVERLKQIGDGIEIAAVLGDRVLVKAIDPRTMMDEVEERTHLHIPRHIKEANTPPPVTGIILKVGQGVKPEDAEKMPPGTMILYDHHAGWNLNLDKVKGFKIMETREIMATLKPHDGLIQEVEPTAA